MLDSNESHGLGDIFLKRFLRKVFASNKFQNISQVDVEGMDLSKVQVLREWQHIDILIILENTVICIENKVLSAEHSEQLTRYKKIIERNYQGKTQVFVYLTPEGVESESEQESYEFISYQFIVTILDRIISVYGDSLNERVKHYIEDYHKIVRRELMQESPEIKLAQKIYQNHKRFFDFIEEHKPDLILRIREMIAAKAKETPQEWVEGLDNKHFFRF